MHTTTPPADTSAPTGTHSRGPRIFPGGDPPPLTARRIRRTRPAPNIAHAPHRGRKTMPSETETESGKSRATRNVAAAFSVLFSRVPVRGIYAEHARNDTRPSVPSPRQRRNGQAGSVLSVPKTPERIPHPKTAFPSSPRRVRDGSVCPQNRRRIRPARHTLR